LRDPDDPRRGLRVRGCILSVHSLERRLVLIQQVLAATLILLFAGFSIWISASALDRQETTFLRNSATQMAASIAVERHETADLATAVGAVLEEGAPVGAHIRVLDIAGHEVASTRGRVAPHETWRAVRVAVEGGGWVIASTSDEPRRRAVLALLLALTVTAVPLFLGFVWIAIDRRRQGWHDKIAGTLVIYDDD